jgi:hypothetical protein
MTSLSVIAPLSELKLLIQYVSMTSLSSMTSLLLLTLVLTITSFPEMTSLSVMTSLSNDISLNDDITLSGYFTIGDDVLNKYQQEFPEYWVLGIFRFFLIISGILRKVRSLRNCRRYFQPPAGEITVQKYQ